MIIYFANLIISSGAVNTFPAISIQVFQIEQFSLRIGSLKIHSLKVAFEFIMI